MTTTVVLERKAARIVDIQTQCFVDKQLLIVSMCNCAAPMTWITVFGLLFSDVTNLETFMVFIGISTGQQNFAFMTLEAHWPCKSSVTSSKGTS